MVEERKINRWILKDVCSTITWFWTLCSRPVSDLRRSPRIKRFARRHSNTFYSSSQPRSRNLERALSASQLSLSGQVDVRSVRSPMRLLFGAADSPGGHSQGTRSSMSRQSPDSSVFEVRTAGGWKLTVHFSQSASRLLQVK